MARILLDYSGSDVRLFFRIFFVVAFILINLVGTKCLAARAKLRLFQRHTVPLPYMTSWLGSFDSLYALLVVKTLPGGWLSLLMIFAYLLNLGSDFTSALIKSVLVHDRCQFGTGLVVQSALIEGVPWNGAPYTVVSQAQTTSLLNDGLQGVYRKANRAVDFSADATDLLGNWHCVRNSLELDYPWDVSVDDIVVSLQQHDLLYDTPYAVSASIGNISHLVIVDTSVGDNVGAVFDVRFSVDTTAYGNETKHMQSYECSLNDTYGELQPVQEMIHSHDTLKNWAEVFQGAVYEGTGTPASNNTGGILEQVLNSMTMVAGGDNYLLDTSHSSETQGCLTQRTHIFWELIMLAGLTLLLLAFLLLFWFGLSIRIKILSGGTDAADAEWIQENTPIGNFEWMAQAVRESQRPRPVEVKTAHLKNWHFGGSSEGGGGLWITNKATRSNLTEEAISLRSSIP
ncbi:uncharacterized protein Z520_06089 [Fonsecaea multimorphosa CBS 102226]|uniref:Uncharacterized protein n=1 Tax=Fonsecaea multimorphosa CBS 102226 TaxID=1442371 RepID=A0A0D2H835_9EURO|nr:uncharacterized protein Z520_06089 [Fonsecaea multimorphosa CBS 102226]KIX98010.1 hypothetical protein Z520_06089 [Fonsecaea multimorphosa CBS 102226]OAL24379.1 hypothetical protein AYO22_05755 [Fonsecaea multimorphosa]